LAIFKCASNRETRAMVRRAGGLDPLCKLVQSNEVHANKRLLAAVTGGIWKCAISPENIMRFNQNSLVASLVPLLEENEDERVLANVVGALAECCKDPVNRDVLRTNEGLPKLVKTVQSREYTSVIFFSLLANFAYCSLRVECIYRIMRKYTYTMMIMMMTHDEYTMMIHDDLIDVMSQKNRIFSFPNKR